MEQQTISRNQLVNQILRIGHGNLMQTYASIGLRAATEEPFLMAHLIAWNQKKGEVRDSKVALPVLALRSPYDAELTENAVAHLVSLDPRNLVRAIHFNKELTKTDAVSTGSGTMLKTAVKQYISVREQNPGWWNRTVLQHRKSIKALYALFHIKPSVVAQAILFNGERPKGSVFEAVGQLKNMAPQEAAGTILNFKIPFLVAVGAVGGVKNKPDIILALIERTSGSELINNTGMFQRLGVFDNPALKAAFDAAVQRAKDDKKVGSLKAGRAAQAAADAGDQKTAKKMQAVQEEKLQQLGGIEGDWLVLGDMSGSMHQSVEVAKQVAALIAQQVKGQVHLVFFNTDPVQFDVTGKSLEDIKQMTRHIRANGGTCIGCGLELLRFKNVLVNGIVLVTDGGENTRPAFCEAYRKYVETIGIEPTVYHLWLPGEQNVMALNNEQASLQVQTFDISQVDYYSLPNIIKALRSSRYSLVDEILGTPLLRLADVFNSNGNNP